MAEEQHNETLTLHERIAARWQSDTGIYADTSLQPMVTGRIDAMMDALPGLASASGAFGAQAFDIASLLAMESRFAYALSPELRAMSLGDLSDIVQVVLEEEELSLEELQAQMAQAKTRQARAVAAKQLAAAKKKATKRMQPGQARRVEAVRRAVAKIRSEAARVRQQLVASKAAEARKAAVAAGVVPAAAPADAAGVSMSEALGGVGTLDPASLPDLAQSLQLLRRQSTVTNVAQPVSARPDLAVSAADMTANVTADRTTSRALRLAVWTADMAMLSPVVDQGFGADAGSTAPSAGRQPGAAGARRSAHPESLVGGAGPADVTTADGAAAPVARQPVQAPQAAAAFDAFAEAPAQVAELAHAPAYRRAQVIAAQQNVARNASTASAARGVQTLAAQPLVAQHLVAQRFAAQRVLTRAAQPALAGADRAASFAAPTPSLQASVASAPGAASSAALDSEVRGAPRAASAHGFAGPLGFSAATLARIIGSQTSHGASGLDTSALDTSALDTPASRMLASLPAGLAPSATTAGLPASVSRWLDLSDAALAHDDVRWLEAFGAGESLNLTEPEALAEAGEASGVGTPAATPRDQARSAARSASPAGAPSWIAPQANRIARQQTAVRARRARTAIDQTVAQAQQGLVVPAGSVARAGETRSLGLEAQGLSPIAGASAVQAYAFASDVSDRLFGGLAPDTTPTTWAPRAATLARAPAQAGLLSLPEPGSVAELQAISGVTGIPVESLTRMGTAAVAQMRGALASQAGAGEWLLPGDDGYDTWAAAQAATAPGERPTALPPKRAAVTAARTRDGDASAGPTRSGVVRTAPGAEAARAATARAPGMQPRAAGAAIERVLAQHERMTAGLSLVSSAAAEQAGQSSGRRSLLDFAAGLDQSDAMFGIAPGGVADAATPWMLAKAAQRLSPEARRTLHGLGAGDLLAIAEDAGHVGATPTGVSSTGAGTAATGASRAPIAASRGATAGTASKTPMSPVHRALLKQLAGTGALRIGAGGAAVVDLGAPQAVRAALAMFGEHGAVGGDTADAFLARFFGRPAPQRTLSPTGELTALQAGTDASPAIGAAGAAAEAAGGATEGDKVVFSGLAGLVALREMKGAGVAESDLLDLGTVESASAKAGSAGPGAAGDASAQAEKAGVVGRARGQAKRAATAARIHRFAPAGLRRSRQLLSGNRPLLRGSPRQLGRSRLGYGDAALGGGALVGLMPGDAGAPGEVFGGTATTRRAEGLGAAIQARRAPRPGQVVRAMPSGGTERTQLRTGSDASVTPISRGRSYANSAAAGFGGNELVSPAAAMERAASAPGASGGGTAARKSQQAGAMARVLSVTAAPTANVLPLVAPAARAVVAQAAAKPMSESIATSGANATSAMSMTGHDVSGQQAAGSGNGAGSESKQESSQPQQELDALAMKVARSVLIRIKRERERRGIHV